MSLQILQQSPQTIVNARIAQLVPVMKSGHQMVAGLVTNRKSIFPQSRYVILGL